MKKPRVLFICHGNVGRSQMAEAFYCTKNGEGTAISAGLDPKTPKKYKSLPDSVISIMQEVEVSLEGQFVKLFHDSMLDQVDRVVVFCKKDDWPDSLLTSKKVDHRPVDDPYQMNAEGMWRVREHIQDIVEGY